MGLVTRALFKEWSTLTLAAAALLATRKRHRRKAAALGALALAARYLGPRRSFHGQSIVIAGGSRGLGFALAQRLLKKGASVSLLARNQDELDRACRLLLPISKNLFTARCDITDSDQLALALAEARARFGTIDGFIHNAGVISVGPFASLTQEDFEHGLDVHLRAAVEATRLLEPYFRINGSGRMIFISSIGGAIGVPHLSSYSASKFALAGFAQSLIAEFGGRSKTPVSVTIAYPSLMRTGSPQNAFFKGAAEDEFLWFNTADHIPLVSMSADRAARRILRAAEEGRREVFVGWPSRLVTQAKTFMPETVFTLMAAINWFLPSSKDSRLRKGVEVRSKFDQMSWSGMFKAREKHALNRYNQV